jgi:CDGSH-type Zn-finger protein
MPRLVRLVHNGPIKIEPSDKPVWVCACGLSRKFPICDGTHKGCKATEPEAGKLYVYDDDRARVVDVRDDAAQDASGTAGPRAD